MNTGFNLPDAALDFKMPDDATNDVPGFVIPVRR